MGKKKNVCAESEILVFLTHPPLNVVFQSPNMISKGVFHGAPGVAGIHDTLHFLTSTSAALQPNYKVKFAPYPPFFTNIPDTRKKKRVPI